MCPDVETEAQKKEGPCSGGIYRRVPTLENDILGEVL